MRLSLRKEPFSLSLGERGEIIAWDYLVRAGYQILEKNYRCKIGEIDVIAKKNRRLHVIEIKTRMHDRCGKPEESVDERKQRKLVRLTEWYLQDKGLGEKSVSFDVIGVHAQEFGEPVIRHIENAFTLESFQYEG